MDREGTFGIEVTKRVKPELHPFHAGFVSAANRFHGVTPARRPRHAVRPGPQNRPYPDSPHVGIPPGRLHRHLGAGRFAFIPFRKGRHAGPS
jgi:hypothetical protein